MATCNDCLFKCYTDDADRVEETCNFFLPKDKYTEVVRCKSCRHFAETKGKDSGKPCGYGRCMKPFFVSMIVDADDFCSYGERREGE